MTTADWIVAILWTVIVSALIASAFYWFAVTRAGRAQDKRSTARRPAALPSLNSTRVWSRKPGVSSDGWTIERSSRGLSLRHQSSIC